MKLPLCFLALCQLVPLASAAELITQIGGPEMHRAARELHLGFSEKGSGSFDLKYKGRSFWALQIGDPAFPLTLSYFSDFKRPSLTIINSWNDKNDFSTAVLKENHSELKASFYFYRGVTFEAFKEFLSTFTLKIVAFEKFQKKEAEQDAAANP